MAFLGVRRQSMAATALWPAAGTEILNRSSGQAARLQSGVALRLPPHSKKSRYKRPASQYNPLAASLGAPSSFTNPNRKEVLMRNRILSGCVLLLLALSPACQRQKGSEFPANRWVQLRKDPVGARRGSAIRYVPDAGSFFLWGFMDSDPDLLQEHPLAEVPEYDMVTFYLNESHWQNHLPSAWESQWKRKLPLAYIARTYAGLTTGSERTVLRGPTDESEGVPRPDLNLVFDQVSYHPLSKSLFYFTGGLTAAYDVVKRRWSDLMPAHTPPPVVAGSLAYDPLNNEMVLFGGGHVAEKAPDGRLIGYTGTWVYRFADGDWHRVQLDIQPSPRMNMRMVCDLKNQALVLFGGDSQSRYLADTWLYDLKTRVWRASKTQAGPEARAGHFTIYEPESGWVIIGGGYNRKDLTDLWAYDVREDRWQRLAGEVPIGFYLTADLAPEKKTILLVTNTRSPGDTTSCNVLYPVRTTYAYRIDQVSWLARPLALPTQAPVLKASTEGTDQPRADGPKQEERLRNLPVNKWTLLADPGRSAPVRTWGSATFDTDRSQILYWGGEHCGYEGNDVDAYDVSTHTWLGKESTPESPERNWNHGVRLAGVTFQGKPWTVHGRRIYSYDPVSQKMIMTRPIRLTSGYDPEGLRLFPTRLVAEYQGSRDALVSSPSSTVKDATWTYDPTTGQWELLGEAPVGVDTLVSTRHGVMGININWPSRLNDAGYLLPWSPSQPPEDKAIYLLDVSRKRWQRLSQGQPSPQNLYEMTSLAYDSKRDQVILHGAGQRREELWTFDVASHQWKNMQPTVLDSQGTPPPVCAREAVYIPEEDVVLFFGSPSGDHGLPAVWTYAVGENGWRRVTIPWGTSTQEVAASNQNRAMIYDPARGLVFLVLGQNGDEGKASVYALRFRLAGTK
jgi:galactose oxidase-like protein